MRLQSKILRMNIILINENAIFSYVDYWILQGAVHK
jgi:hypothetical protein